LERPAADRLKAGITYHIGFSRFFSGAPDYQVVFVKFISLGGHVPTDFRRYNLRLLTG